MVNSMECLNWLEQLLELLWIPGSDAAPPYQGLPLVILALDDSITSGKTPSPHTHTSSPPPPSTPTDDTPSGQLSDTPLCRRARRLASRLQCVLIAERPTVQPMRLVVTSVISQLLNSLTDSISIHAEFLTSDLKFRPEGFK